MRQFFGRVSEKLLSLTSPVISRKKELNQMNEERINIYKVNWNFVRYFRKDIFRYMF